jgi:hypothetical protein
MQTSKDSLSLQVHNSSEDQTFLAQDRTDEIQLIRKRRLTSCTLSTFLQPELSITDFTSHSPRFNLSLGNGGGLVEGLLSPCIQQVDIILLEKDVSYAPAHERIV